MNFSQWTVPITQWFIDLPSKLHSSPFTYIFLLLRSCACSCETRLWFFCNGLCWIFTVQSRWWALLFFVISTMCTLALGFAKSLQNWCSVGVKFCYFLGFLCLDTINCVRVHANLKKKDLKCIGHSAYESLSFSFFLGYFLCFNCYFPSNFCLIVFLIKSLDGHSNL